MSKDTLFRFVSMLLGPEWCPSLRFVTDNCFFFCRRNVPWVETMMVCSRLHAPYEIFPRYDLSCKLSVKVLFLCFLALRSVCQHTHASDLLVEEMFCAWSLHHRQSCGRNRVAILEMTRKRAFRWLLQFERRTKLQIRRLTPPPTVSDSKTWKHC